jgi:nicotinate phosphoribosyltransferase
VVSVNKDVGLGLHVDLYELRMVESYLRRGMLADATFSLYARPCPRRPWLVAAGLHAALEVIERFRYGAAELEYLREIDIGESTLQWLAAYRPRADVWAVPEGTVVLGNEPLLEITGPLPDVQLLEAALMNVVHLWTVIATKAARCCLAARGRAVVDFGMRRAHGLETAVDAALAAYVGGCAGTSNLEAGRRGGIPVVGTMAHSYIQAHADELSAFRAFAADFPDASVLLVDTYDTLSGVRNAIVVADELRAQGHRLRGVRLDSGDLAALARATRTLLDTAGHHDVEIFASGGLDEAVIASLRDAPIDAFGVGTALTVSKDLPALDIAYKLVDYDGTPRAKYSEGKVLLPGRKQVFRTGDPSRDVLGCHGERHEGRPLLQPVYRIGRRLDRETLADARERAQTEIGGLPHAWRSPVSVDPPPQPALSPELDALSHEVRRRTLGSPSTSTTRPMTEGGNTMEESKVLTIEVLIEETIDRTDAKAITSIRGERFAGWGRARRNPSDSPIPKVGEELATARALSDLSHQLLEAACTRIEESEGRPVHVHA